jgi:predicted  nucleic acid-binding Zn-ribbon protein
MFGFWKRKRSWKYERNYVMGKIEEIDARVKAQADGIAETSAALAATSTALRGDVTGLKGEIAILKSEIEALKAAGVDPVALAALENSFARLETATGGLAVNVSSLQALDAETLPAEPVEPPSPPPPPTGPPA